MLFTVTALTGGLDAAQVAVLDLQTGTRKILVRGGSHAHYVSSGHLVYAAAGTLRAVAFDLPRQETRGTPVPVVLDVVMKPFGAVDAVVASDGTLAYVAGGVRRVRGRSAHSCGWTARAARHRSRCRHARISILGCPPTAGAVAVAANDQEADIWVWDLSRTTFTRATFDPGLDLYPVWTRDSRRLIFSSDRAGVRNLYWQAADGTGAVERLTESPKRAERQSRSSPDGAADLHGDEPEDGR